MVLHLRRICTGRENRHLTSSLPSVWPTVVPHVSARLPLKGFIFLNEILCIALLRKSVQNFHVWLKSDIILREVLFYIVDSTVNPLLRLNYESECFCIVDSYDKSRTIPSLLLRFFLFSSCTVSSSVLSLLPFLSFIFLFISLWKKKVFVFSHDSMFSLSFNPNWATLWRSLWTPSWKISLYTLSLVNCREGL